MKLLLICNTPIIEHIFALVCKRVNIDLTIEKSTKIKDKFDFIVVDQPFIGKDFILLKKYTKSLAAISSEELNYDMPKEFMIPRPFLPTKLEIILKEQMEALKYRLENDHNLDAFIDDNRLEVEDIKEDDLDEKVEDRLSEDFFETLIDDDFDDSFFTQDENEDESIVSLDAIRQGGVLDSNELKKINSFLSDNKKEEEKLENIDWKDISQIIDDALEEVKDYEFDAVQEDYHLILNRYKMDDLKPLLTKLNQDLIDRLAKNETVNIKISLKEN